ncbi:MAG: hypothetical protein IT449_12975 [Phycisphaerales bacterium]|nr:hypothetical protein [Phycisphaerales bacterium]
MRRKFVSTLALGSISATVVVALALAQSQPADPAGSPSPASAPVSSQPASLDRAAYDRYLWDLAHHPDTLAAFEMMISTNPSEPNPWAWHAGRLPAAFNSKKTFDEWFDGDMQRLYGANARPQWDRRLAIAKKLDHTLWELFQALVVYNRDVFLSREQIVKAMADAKIAVPQNPTLLARLAFPSVKESLPPARPRPEAGG